MKIAVNTRLLQSPVTGIQKFILNLYRLLPVRDSKSDYLFFQTSDSGPFGKKNVFRLPDTNFFNLFFDLLLVHLLILKHRPSVFHGPSHLLPVFKYFRTKYVLTIHDLSFITHPHIMNRTWSAVYRLFTGLSVRNADFIVTDSASTRRDVLRVFKTSPQKVRVIHLGISPDYLAYKPLASLYPRPYLLSVATHPLRKNILSSLQAYANLLKKNATYDYLIIGPGSTDGRISAAVAKLNLQKRVVLCGVVGDVDLRAYYQHAQLFIYPSLYEGFGLPILEAMTQKTLVLTSNISSMPELMPNKDCLVDPMNISDIELKMNRLLNLTDQEKSRIIDRNWHFAQKFTWEKCSAAYLKLFSQIA